MDKKKIERINYLAKKSRESGLTDTEKQEQAETHTQAKKWQSLLAKLQNSKLVKH